MIHCQTEKYYIGWLLKILTFNWIPTIAHKMQISVTNVVIKIENKCVCAEKSLFMFLYFEKTVYVKSQGLLFYVEIWKLVVADLGIINSVSDWQKN